MEENGLVLMSHYSSQICALYASQFNRKQKIRWIRFVKPVLGQMLRYVLNHIPRHMPVRYVLMHVPKFVPKYMPNHVSDTHMITRHAPRQVFVMHVLGLLGSELQLCSTLFLI